MKLSIDFDAIENMGPTYRTDVPTPAEYQPVWCSRCKVFHTRDPLWYNRAVDSMSTNLVTEIDGQILEDLLELGTEQ